MNAGNTKLVEQAAVAAEGAAEIHNIPIPAAHVAREQTAASLIVRIQTFGAKIANWLQLSEGCNPVIFGRQVSVSDYDFHWNFHFDHVFILEL